MGSSPLSTLDCPPKVSIVYTILTLSQQSLGSCDLAVVPSPISSSLPITQVYVPLPHSSFGEPLLTSTHNI